MTAKEIRDTAFLVLHHACNNANNDLEFKSELGNLLAVLSISTDQLDKSIYYIRVAQLAKVSRSPKEETIVIKEFSALALNCLADEMFT